MGPGLSSCVGDSPAVDRTEFLEALRSLRMAPAEQGGRHPHKPLLLLWLLGRAHAGDFGPFAYDDVEGPVDELLAEFGTPAKRDLGRAAMPFFHLEESLWHRHGTVDGEELDDQRGRLRRARAIGAFSTEVRSLLERDAELAPVAARLLLDEHFTDSHVEPISNAIGIELDGATPGALDLVVRRRRDPAFRMSTLKAYGYTCAMCGWDGSLKTQPIGLEAAHIRWHSQGGSDDPDNGLALCSLHHKLLDLGVLGLTPDHHIEVADDYVASSEIGHRMGHELHDHPLRPPQPRHPRPAEAHIEWHRTEVFHGAAS